MSAKAPRKPTRPAANVAARGPVKRASDRSARKPAAAHTVRGAISGALRKRLKLKVTCVDSVHRIVEAQA